MDLPGHQRNVQKLVDEYYESLYRYAYRLAGCAAEAEDLTQETFCKAQVNLGQLRDLGRAKAWLFRILHNAHIDRYRASSRTVQTVDELEGQDPAFVIHETPESLVMSGLMDAEVKRALMEIPEVFRACLIRRILKGSRIRKSQTSWEYRAGP